jgi:glycosyltransferase involved in cell wall biosynthesis
VRLAIDLQGAQGENRGRGIGRFAQNLAEAIIRQSGRHDITIFLNGALETPSSDLQRHFIDLLCPKSVKVWSPGDAPERAREDFLAGLAPDMVLVPSLFEGIVTPAFTSIPVSPGAPPTAVVMHDLIPLVRRDLYLDDNPALERWYTGKLEHLRRADLLLCNSNDTRRDCITLLPFDEKRVLTIGGGVDPRIGPERIPFEEALDLRRKLGLTKPFVMYVGGIDPRKNIEGLIDAFADLPTEVRRRHQIAVVCAASEADQARLRARAAAAGLPSDCVVLTGAVTDEILVKLYNLCRLFVFPSLHEGFGLPALEAMACGAPVIASTGGSLPEVVGREDALFPPHDKPVFVSRLLAGLVDEAWRASLSSHGLRRARDFTWDGSAERALAAMEAYVAAKPGPAKPKRPRLAYVSPMPPAPTGIADYSAELLPELAAHYQIEVTVDPDGFERRLYHIGNSDHHSHMFDLLRRHPGVVVLHDAYLGHILAHRDKLGETIGGWTRALYASHGYAALAMDREEAILRYPGSFEVLAAAQGVIVHSAFARDLIQRWFPGLPEHRLETLPLLRAAAEPVDRGEARRALGLADDQLILCSFGMAGPLKLNLRLIDAFLSSSLTEARLIFVGANDPGAYGQALTDKIAASGGRVTLTGHLPLERYRLYAAAADMAIQLRADSRGETSAALLDCLNYGLPTIANANGSAAEIPADAVRLIPDTFTDAELTAALNDLGSDSKARARLAKAGRKLVQRDHAPRPIAKRYAEIIERFSALPVPAEIAPQSRLLVDISEPANTDLLKRWLLDPPSGWRIEPVYRDGPLYRFARRQTLEMLGLSADGLTDEPMNASGGDRLVSLAALSPDSLVRQLFVDISELVVRDAKTGIQRVVHNILREWRKASPPGWRIEPVFASVEAPYRYARAFFGQGEDEPIRPVQGDCFVGLDLQPTVVPHNRPALAELKRKGVAVLFVAYDLLCVERPDWFFPGAADTFSNWLDVVAESDGVLCISAAVAESLRRWLTGHRPEVARTLPIGHFRLGGDFAPAIDAPWPGKPAGPMVLTVGTLEPRKGHSAALAAAEALWAEGEDFSLVIAGKAGWLMERLGEYIRRHPEHGKRLFWFSAADDRLLASLYRAADGVLAASEGEGFGLPLVEAARYDLPVLARDLPVFHEVAGDHVTYFGDDFKGAWRDWLAALRDGTAIRSGGIPPWSWAESARELMEKVLAMAARRRE